jgi:DNA-binding XRE family transcriptional regulator
MTRNCFRRSDHRAIVQFGTPAPDLKAELPDRLAVHACQPSGCAHADAFAKGRNDLNLLSQDALAADAGVFQKLISGIENGRANPELDTLGKIAAALGVHPRELLDE